ncbi:MAG: NAD(P)-binding domain-containing protein, partial [Planctomycetaceae bacterium]|nr:NAD(P)-binding domain-containing protein [Planctomycetaceae bacterium]
MQTVGIIGTGVMGRSIALRVLQHGFDVRLFDSNPEAIALAAAWVETHGGAAPAIATSLADLAGRDLLIEAVVENRAVKRRVLGNLAAANPSALIATNTSSLSIGELAESVSDAGRFCGLHFCHPIELCPLVEIVPCPTTSEATLRRAEAFVQRLEMQPLPT